MTQVLFQSHCNQRLGRLALPSSPAFSPLSLWLREQGASFSLGFQQEEMEGSTQKQWDPGGEGTSPGHP